MPTNFCEILVTIIVMLSLTGSIQSSTEENVTNKTEAAKKLIERLIGERADSIKLEYDFNRDENDSYEILAENGRVTIKGNSPVAITRGFYDYLKSACNSQVTWSGKNISIPEVFPDYKSGKVVCPNHFRMYYNVCTFGYTTAFWNWERWEEEIDWMALHGINMPLAMKGQEAIWQKVWNYYGITNEQLKDHFSGPAFLPWHRMGNINNHGGPLPQKWIDDNKQLQKKILDRMRELGMTPIVPAFSGFVPETFKAAKPDAKVINLEPWTGFGKKCATYILDPLSPYFPEIGKKFIDEYKKEFGEVKYYLADSFNELKVPVTEEGRYKELADFGEAVYKSILAGDPDGTWVMMGWLFFFDDGFWDKPSAKALLSKIPDDRMIILDLANDIWHGWKKHDSFYGKQWIYSIIHDFGGTNRMFGDLKFCAEDPSVTLNNPAKEKLIGFGLSPEGIENNEIIYELLLDASWNRNPIDPDKWLKTFLASRYGSASKESLDIWKMLKEKLYVSFNLGNSIFSFGLRPGWRNVVASIPDDEKQINAVRAFLGQKELYGNQLYKNDLIDIVANMCCKQADLLLAATVKFHDAEKFNDRDKAFDEAKKMILNVDNLFSFREDKTLNRWIDYARQWGNSEEEKNYYEENAKRQITVWGGPDLSEYAAKLWSGLIKDYYLVRWERYFDSLKTGKPVDLYKWEEEWIVKPYKSNPMKEAIREAGLFNFAGNLLDEIEKLNSSEIIAPQKFEPLKEININNLKPGLELKLYESKWKMLPDFSRLTPKNTSIAEKVTLEKTDLLNNFALKYDGYLFIENDGQYYFALATDDGGKLYLNGKEIINTDGQHKTKEQFALLDLKKGFYPFTLEYFQCDGSKNLKLYYKFNSELKQDFTEKMFFH
ncbi:MAG: alpha-N-acetylglucosaminidase [Ignavibacteriales bacterium]|nr:MAG: alpha-N-acetylglucosaminidase [Ignavibacteriales bacterium]